VSDRIAKASRHRTGQPVVRLNGRDHYLGKFGSSQAKAEYTELIGRWLAGGRPGSAQPHAPRERRPAGGRA
jgi:hypothetical protein